MPSEVESRLGDEIGSVSPSKGDLSVLGTYSNFISKRLFAFTVFIAVEMSGGKRFDHYLFLRIFNGIIFIVKTSIEHKRENELPAKIKTINAVKESQNRE